MATRNIENPVLNKISNAEYAAKVTAGVITDTMIEEQVWFDKDFTVPEQHKVLGIEAGAQVNKIESVKVNGVAVTPDSNKAVNINTFSGSYNDLTDKPAIPSVAGLASESYVDGKVAALINSAPTTLDTLGEVATALQNNAGTVEALNASIGNKANKADLATVATSGSYTDLTDKPTIPSIAGLATETYVNNAVSGKANASALAAVATSGSYNDLKDKPTIGSCTLKIWD